MTGKQKWSILFLTQIIPDLIGMIVQLLGALIYLLFLCPILAYIVVPTGIIVTHRMSVLSICNQECRIGKD